MKIHCPSNIPYSREAVFKAYRDDLTDLVQYLPNIEKVEVVKREETADGVIEFENHWYADAPIPKVAQAFIKPEMLKWIDYAKWDQNSWTCDWRIETFFMRDAVSCGGRNEFNEAGADEMALTISGDLVLNAKAVPGIPKLLAGTIKPQLEKFIVSLITPNFETINRGIIQFLKNKG